MITILSGDMRTKLRELPDNSLDACVTDPPYGLGKVKDISQLLITWIVGGDGYDIQSAGFMDKEWDILPSPNDWREVYRVLKPGAHLAVFAGTRTADLMGVSLRLAGFEVRDAITYHGFVEQLDWLYVSGMPKSVDIGKEIDRTLGANRQKIRIDAKHANNPKVIRSGKGVEGAERPYIQRARELGYHELDGPVPVTVQAQMFDGWGTGLKPAHEPILMCRKPLIGSIGRNVIAYGTGGINIQACRIPATQGEETRWPANVLLAHHYDCIENGECHPECPVGHLDQQAGHSKSGNKISNGGKAKNVYNPRNYALPFRAKGDAGPRSRMLTQFRLVNKASQSERNTGNVDNVHLTVKPQALLQWLIQLITPPGGIVLDPYAGSGSTGLAASQLGIDCVLCEREEQFIEIIKMRCGMQPTTPEHGKRVATPRKRIINPDYKRDFVQVSLF